MLRQHFKLAASDAAGIGFRRKVMPGVVGVVLRNKKRRTALLLFPPPQYQPTAGAAPGPCLPKVRKPPETSLTVHWLCCQDSWCRCLAWHGVPAPVDIGGLIGQFNRGRFVYQRLGCHPLPKSFLVNCCLSILTF